MRRQWRDIEQDALKCLGKAGAAEGRRECADHGDADLYRREETIGVLGQFQCDCRAMATKRRLLFQAALARRDDRDLGSREESVCKDENKNNQQFEHYCSCHSSSPNRIRLKHWKQNLLISG